MQTSVKCDSCKDKWRKNVVIKVYIVYLNVKSVKTSLRIEIISII